MKCVLISLFTGQCSEYSISGNMIQLSSKAGCLMFNNNPCPLAYRSTEAYKCELKVTVKFQYDTVNKTSY